MGETYPQKPGRGGRLALASVAALPDNPRQLAPGMGGRLPLEAVAAFVWNGWQLCRAISGRLRRASVATLPWNTHPRLVGAESTAGDRVVSPSTQPASKRLSAF